MGRQRVKPFDLAADAEALQSSHWRAFALSLYWTPATAPVPASQAKRGAASHVDVLREHRFTHNFSGSQRRQLRPPPCRARVPGAESFR